MYQVVGNDSGRAELFRESLDIARRLRAAGINTEVQMESRKLAKQFQYASRAGIRFVVLAGEDELARGVVTVKDLLREQQFDVKREDPRVRDKYGPGLGEQMMLARRLCEAGVGFVTLHYGGWDMHGGIKDAMKNLGPKVDHAVAAFVEDCHDRGLDRDVLLVITGEFGRTPKVNGSAGRDHWAPLSTLALAGGGLRMGQTIGESTEKVEVPKSQPIGPQDLMATVFHVLGMPQDLHYKDPSGRPTPMINAGKPIAELI